MSSTATIAEIAARAGVGTATVDRVLNKRPGVNADTVQRVLQVVAEIGTPPQRGRPRRDANLRFAFVLPADDTPFLELVDRQIAQSAGDFRHQHITEVTYRLDAGDGEQFAASLAQVAECEGVALMAPDLPPVKLAINELVRSGVHVVTLFSDVAGSMRETHVGADSRAAGRTAGLLLGAHGERLAARHAAARLAGDAPVGRDRAPDRLRAGARGALSDAAHAARCPTCPRATRRRGALSRASCRRASTRQRVAGLYNVGSGSAGLARALADAGLADDVAMAAHDLTDQHRSLLSNGSFAYLLTQDIHYCVGAAARVLRALCENVRGALNVVQPRVEILTAENLQ